MKMKLLRHVRQGNYFTFDRLFMTAMLLIQLILFLINPDSFLGTIAGISGIISVMLCAKGKISFYFVGFVQSTSYLILSWQNCFYGEVIENAFYIITMIWGIFIWKKHLTRDASGSMQVQTLKFSKKQWLLSVTATIIGTFLMGDWLSSIGSHQAYTDAATNVLSIFAQLLMIKRYREQWVWWLVIDILGLKLWLVAGNWEMTAMYAAWIINCIYGWKSWNRLEEKKLPHENQKACS